MLSSVTVVAIIRAMFVVTMFHDDDSSDIDTSDDDVMTRMTTPASKGTPAMTFAKSANTTVI